MEHILRSRPVVATVAAIAAGTVMLATTTAEPPKPTAAITPRVSVEVVELAALPVAAAAIDQVSVRPSLPNIAGGVIAGAGSGAFLGYISAGLVAVNVLNKIPVLGQALTPLVPLVGIVGALVGIPIGMVAGAVAAVRNWVTSLRSQPSSSASATTSHRSVRPGPRPDRKVTKTSEPRKAATPQRRSHRPGSGLGHSGKGVTRH
ncbi:hypothetical protein ACRDU6_02035 [Mycolicibacterium sp. ELW1]|uniref:hypothetical protein n=1 Tax=Mycobacteriaceae TaxID=1762 RepID=UPI0011EC2429|nr:hypothetical protein [Mycobacterium sp. ELW1]QEN16693.1 hypothetical protein D3H54_28595 [Mycobacterium sp. ELW1]